MCTPKKIEFVRKNSEDAKPIVFIPEPKCSGQCKACKKAKREHQEPHATKRLTLLALLLTATVPVFAQPASTSSFWDDPFNHPMLPMYIVIAFIFVTIVLISLVGFYLVKIVNLFTTQAEKERAEKAGVPYVPRPAWWSRFFQTVNDTVPVEDEHTIELDHNYDGIKELDNHLPPWWKWLFVGTIGWAAVYLLVFHFSKTLPLQEQEYDNEVAYAEKQSILLAASRPQAVVDELTLVYSEDAAILQAGRQVYLANCVACHKNDGGGNAIGPNLTDAYWLHGGEIRNVFATVKNGIVDKGMPAWGKVMSPKDVRDVAFFVMSLQGTNPPQAKAAQGELYKPAPVTTDSTKTQVSNKL